VDQDLTIKPKNLKRSEKNIGETLEDIGAGIKFLDGTPKAQETKQE
jgi:hypothetical protein